MGLERADASHQWINPEAHMPNLLHLDASIRPTGSVSRDLSSCFAAEWRSAHPDGGYIYRDLVTSPVPHLTHRVREALLNPDGEHPQLTDEERSLNAEVLAEVHWATTILIGLPMYNYSVPSSVKAWLDRVILPAYLVEFVGDAAPLKGKAVVAVTARGASYAAGTPREDCDFQEPYLRALFAAVGIDDVSFVHAEMTMFKELPHLAEYWPLADQSLAAALEKTRSLATGSDSQSPAPPSVVAQARPEDSRSASSSATT
jgi:FMN-dependent NADH-azoreductase